MRGFEDDTYISFDYEPVTDTSTGIKVRHTDGAIQDIDLRSAEQFARLCSTGWRLGTMVPLKAQAKQARAGRSQGKRSREPLPEDSPRSKSLRTHKGGTRGSREVAEGSRSGNRSSHSGEDIGESKEEAAPDARQGSSFQSPLHSLKGVRGVSGSQIVALSAVPPYCHRYAPS